MSIQGELSAYVEEYVGAQRLVDAFAYGERAQEGFSSINRKLYAAGERAQFLSSLANPGTRFVNNCMYAVVAVVGFVGVVTGFPAVLTVGDVQVFLSYANQYTKPFNEISGVVTQIQGAFASARRYSPCSMLPRMTWGRSHSTLIRTTGQRWIPRATLSFCTRFGCRPWGQPSGWPQGDVVFDHVDFSYEPDHPLLQDICLHARPGMRMALVGPTGCGKTTLINLLLRFYDTDSGEILVDDRPLPRIPGRTCGACSAWCCRRAGCSRVPYATIFRTAGRTPHASRWRRPHAAPAPMRSFELCPTATTRWLPENGGSLSQGQRQLLCIRARHALRPRHPLAR